MRRCIGDCKALNTYLVISYNKQRNTEMNATSPLQYCVLGHCGWVSLLHPALYGEPFCLIL